MLLRSRYRRYPEPIMATITCSYCGRIAEEPQLTWVLEFDPRRGSIWICRDCARANLRSIEAKLDQEYW